MHTSLDRWGESQNGFLVMAATVDIYLVWLSRLQPNKANCWFPAGPLQFRFLDLKKLNSNNLFLAVSFKLCSFSNHADLLCLFPSWKIEIELC